jgi:methylated-DNA-[protein]-cysteine S-methyltransferase
MGRARVEFAACEKDGSGVEAAADNMLQEAMNASLLEREMDKRTKSHQTAGYCLFDTAIGPCGVAWSERGLTALLLPGADRWATEKRLRAISASTDAGIPPPGVKRAIAEIQRYLAGSRIDFSSVAIDLPEVSPFYRRVYAAARGVGWGHTATYGQLARRAGSPKAARAVGQALSRNPIPIIIPCHRILAHGSRVGGFSAYGGTRTKQRLLSLEGVHFGAGAARLPGI